MSKEMERIEAVLDEKVRPALRAHGGEMEARNLEPNGAEFSFRLPLSEEVSE